MVSKAEERSSKLSAVTLPASIDDRISLWILKRSVSVEWNFLYADWYWLGVFELFTCEFSWFTTTFSRTLKRKLRLDTGQYVFLVSWLRVGFPNNGETKPGLKCEGREPSVSDKLIIDVTGVIRKSIQSFTKLVGIGSKSDDSHGISRTRRRTSAAVAQVRFFQVSGGFSIVLSVRKRRTSSVSQKGRKSEWQRRTSNVCFVADSRRALISRLSSEFWLTCLLYV